MKKKVILICMAALTWAAPAGAITLWAPEGSTVYHMPVMPLQADELVATPSCMERLDGTTFCCLVTDTDAFCSDGVLAIDVDGFYPEACKSSECKVKKGYQKRTCVNITDAKTKQVRRFCALGTIAQGL